MPRISQERISPDKPISGSKNAVEDLIDGLLPKNPADVTVAWLKTLKKSAELMTDLTIKNNLLDSVRKTILAEGMLAGKLALRMAELNLINPNDIAKLEASFHIVLRLVGQEEQMLKSFDSNYAVEVQEIQRLMANKPPKP